ncbi:MAG: L,D-transpeptidase family protein [Rickettsiales bacterium]|jgi:murein L,D-transpeptidase YcbB/YkuD|nr:L,D-transpeptidase family protein [Rickettsiales bacterium]
MRYIYGLILFVAAMAYPVLAIHAMSSAPPDQAISESGRTSEITRLEKLLVKYRALEEKGGWPAFKVSQKKIEPGDSDPRIETLREMLSVMGDHTKTKPEDPMLYDESLVASVMGFQRRHGLTDDGVIGRETQLALSVPVSKRIRQIEGTIARIQAFTPDPAERRLIIVNIPEFMLHAYQDGKEVASMKVVVGTPKDQTPQFTRNMTYVSFNPHWGVPIRIAAEEMLPKIMEDPEFFTKQDFALYELTADGRSEIQPETVDWSVYNKDHFPFLLRQRPGKGNALGKIKFGLKDSNAIYLHDTSAPKFFLRDVRAFSHGCIRVEKPYELAKFVFDGHEKITPERMETLYQGDESRIITIPAIPVHTVYWSAWADSEGTAHFRKDVYGLD